MSTSTMTSKGQITVPKEVRDDLGLEAGTKVIFVKVGRRRYELVPRTTTFDDLDGMLHRPGQRARTLEEMDEGIAEGAWHGAMGEDTPRPTLP